MRPQTVPIVNSYCFDEIVVTKLILSITITAQLLMMPRFIPTIFISRNAINAFETKINALINVTLYKQLFLK